MIPDEYYTHCLPILSDESLMDEVKTDKLEEVLRRETHLTGKALENAILDALWRFHETGRTASRSPPSRLRNLQRPVAPVWQVNRSQLSKTSVNSKLNLSTVSSAASVTTMVPTPTIIPTNLQTVNAHTSASSYVRSQPSTLTKSPNFPSPFTPSHQSPQLALASSHIPYSPSLDNYKVSTTTTNSDAYRYAHTYGSEWVTGSNNDDNQLVSAIMPNNMRLSNVSAEPSLLDILGSIFKDSFSDQEIERALEQNNYDLGITIMALSKNSPPLTANKQQQQSQRNTAIWSSNDKSLALSNSMSPVHRPATPGCPTKTSIMCKYWLATGHCYKADCRFSHDPSKTICRYWVAGNCLASESCIFSHDPSSIVTRLSGNEGSNSPANASPLSLFLQDYDAFSSSLPPPNQTTTDDICVPGTKSLLHASRSTYHPSVSATFDDPSLPKFASLKLVDSRAVAGTNLDDSVLKLRNQISNGSGVFGLDTSSSSSSSTDSAPKFSQQTRILPTPLPICRGQCSVAMKIPIPKQLPWLMTGAQVNEEYMNARNSALKHGALRKKYLQNALLSWSTLNSPDSMDLSKRGIKEHNLMRQAHRKAAKIIFEDRLSRASDDECEIFIDLHGLDPEEAIIFLSRCIRHYVKIRDDKKDTTFKPLYIVCGTVQNSRNGKAKISRAARLWLKTWGFIWREFDVPGDRKGEGGILGIDPFSWDNKLGYWRKGQLIKYKTAKHVSNDSSAHPKPSGISATDAGTCTAELEPRLVAASTPNQSPSLSSTHLSPSVDLVSDSVVSHEQPESISSSSVSHASATVVVNHSSDRNLESAAYSPESQSPLSTAPASSTVSIMPVSTTSISVSISPVQSLDPPTAILSSSASSSASLSPSLKITPTSVIASTDGFSHPPLHSSSPATASSPRKWRSHKLESDVK